MKPTLILLSVFLFAGCESDFDKCMNYRVSSLYDEFTKDNDEIEWEKTLIEMRREAYIEHGNAEYLEERIKIHTDRIAEIQENIRYDAENKARKICNSQGLYE